MKAPINTLFRNLRKHVLILFSKHGFFCRLLVFCCLSLQIAYPICLEAHPEQMLPFYTKAPDSKDAPPRIPDQTGRPLWELDPKVPFVGSPVHEKMTIASITLSNVHGRPYHARYDEAYIHGVFWNDDPEDLLCPECSFLNLRKFDKRWGIDFAVRFTNAKKKVRTDTQGPKKVAFGSGDGLLERSHFGDMQFLHAMAARNGEPARETQEKILVWAEFVYKVATGEIRLKTKIEDVPITNIPKLFINDRTIRESTVAKLFKGPLLARRVAIGSLLHIIQDSYAPGHIERENLDSSTSGKIVFNRGKILRFHCYTGQDEKLHSIDDKWPEGLDAEHPEGDLNPISAGVHLLKLLYREPDSASWTEVEHYLQQTVFQISDPGMPSSPGERYKKTRR